MLWDRVFSPKYEVYNIPYDVCGSFPPTSLPSKQFAKVTTWVSKCSKAFITDYDYITRTWYWRSLPVSIRSITNKSYCTDSKVTLTLIYWGSSHLQSTNNHFDVNFACYHRKATIATHHNCILTSVIIPLASLFLNSLLQLIMNHCPPPAT